MRAGQDERRADRPRGRWTGLGVLAMLAAVGGCSQGGSPNRHFACACRQQIQFYTPPGASVTVDDCPRFSWPVATYTEFDNRMEQTPEEYCVFNLCSGTYEFKYSSAEGLPGVSVYGELIVPCVCGREARTHRRRSFVPVALPSEYYRRVEVAGDEIFPFRGEACRTAVDAHDIERLKQGDVVDKVFVVADLEHAEKVKRDTEVKIARCEREIEYADARFRLAYLDFRIDVDDECANFFGTDKTFIGWEAKRVQLQQKLEKLEALLKRTTALLRGDHVLIRKGMLAVATREVVEHHRDPVEATEDLGEVILVMRIGGRHMHWGDPQRETAEFKE